MNKITHSTLPDILKERFKKYLSMDYPKLLEINSEFYGKYYMRPIAANIFHLSYDGMDVNIQEQLMDQWLNSITDFKKMFVSITQYKIICDNYPDVFDFMVLYACDIEDNKDWYENNKDCDYIKTNFNYISKAKKLPIAIKTKTKADKYIKIYPLAALDIK